MRSGLGRRNIETGLGLGRRSCLQLHVTVCVLQYLLRLIRMYKFRLRSKKNIFLISSVLILLILFAFYGIGDLSKNEQQPLLLEVLKEQDQYSKKERQQLLELKQQNQSSENERHEKSRKPRDVSRYVSFSVDIRNGRRLGNQIFSFAAVVYVAELTGRQVAIVNSKKPRMEKDVFDLNVEHYGAICPCYTIGEKSSRTYDRRITEQVLNNKKTIGKSIRVSGYRESWKYTIGVEQRIRNLLLFKSEMRSFAKKFLSNNNIPTGWNDLQIVRVGIHVRRGDFLKKQYFDRGLRVPGAQYFKNAMKYFTDRYERVWFVVTSDDSKWTRENLAAPVNKSAVVSYTVGHSAGQDLAILSLCDHVIMSIGTFGWWGAWLANGTTVYFKDFVAKGSRDDKKINRNDYYPPHWIGFGE